ncbi:putative 18.3 kDa protein [Escherichia phage 310Ecol104PP]|nr:putative 18.3 kDa protein [Escherichia phage 310Ecol104PP]WPJ71202.1 molybdenum ABC transporter, periplasmic molybdenum-binding protein [Escherichia phage vB-Eco-KMB39]
MIEVAKHYSIEFMSKEGKSVNTLDKKCSLIIPLAENPDLLIKDIKERKYPENVILIIKHTEDILQNTDSPFSSSEALTIKGYKRAHEYGLFDLFEDDKVKLVSQPSKSKTFIIEDIKDINAFVKMVWAHFDVGLRWRMSEEERKIIETNRYFGFYR